VLLKFALCSEGRRKKEEGRRKKEEGRRPFGFAQGEKKEEGRRKKEEGTNKQLTAYVSDTS